MKRTLQIVASALLLSFAFSGLAQTNSGLTKDQIVANRVAGKLTSQDRFHRINVEVDDRVASLSGTVDLYIDKLDAQKKAEKVAGVRGVRNDIVVEGRRVSDAELENTLANKLRYDRAGYGIVFNHLAVTVTDGKAVVSGKVRDYPDRDSAIAVVATTPGVRGVVNQVSVAPVSAFDDQLRIRLARAIYGHSNLQQYAMDPQAPIRIVVENGRVELYGAVRSEMDKQIAFLEANSVPGAFGLTNHIVVAR